MLAVKNAPAPELLDISAANEAMTVVADGLLGHDFNVLVPAWESSCLLKVTNAPGALSELIIAADGSVTWEYRCLDSRRADEAQFAAVVLSLLGAESSSGDESLTVGLAPVWLRGAVESLLRERGMKAVSEILVKASDSCAEDAETAVTNPTRPDRGSVRFADGGSLWWDCQLSDPSAAVAGVDLPEVVAAIAAAMHLLGSGCR